MKFKPK